MISLQKLLWSVATKLFTAFILLDLALWGEYENVVENNFNETKFDFIIGKLSRVLNKRRESFSQRLWNECVPNFKKYANIAQSS